MGYKYGAMVFPFPISSSSSSIAGFCLVAAIGRKLPVRFLFRARHARLDREIPTQ
jgi:hypothetical protein